VIKLLFGVVSGVSQWIGVLDRVQIHHWEGEVLGFFGHLFALHFLSALVTEKHI